MIMRELVGSRAAVGGLLGGLVLLTASCAVPRSQYSAQGAPPPGEWLLVVTDKDGKFLGAVPFQHPLGAESIMIRTSDILLPEDLDKVKPDKTFLATGFKTITIFDMGDPCTYVIQGGKAVKKCW
jgi:hypothetical protein